MHHTLPMGQDVIMGYLPHRDPMLFIDRVTALEDGHITAESDIRPDANFFKGHFPDRPIMPGVLIIETVAQAGALLVSLTRGLDDDKFIAFSGVESAKFRKPVQPGDTLIINVDIERVRLPYYKFSGTAHVNGELAANLKFAAAQMDFNEAFA